MNGIGSSLGDGKWIPGSRQENLAEMRLVPRLANRKGADRSIRVELQDKWRGEFGPNVGDHALCSVQGSPSLGVLVSHVSLILHEVVTKAEARLLHGPELFLAPPYD